MSTLSEFHKFTKPKVLSLVSLNTALQPVKTLGKHVPSPMLVKPKVHPC